MKLKDLIKLQNHESFSKEYVASLIYEPEAKDLPEWWDKELDYSWMIDRQTWEAFEKFLEKYGDLELLAAKQDDVKVSAKISFYHSQNINLIPDNSKEKLCTMVIDNRTQACVIDFEESRLGEVVLINEKYVTLREGFFHWSNL